MSPDQLYRVTLFLDATFKPYWIQVISAIHFKATP